tara:strand:- start:4561 stop:4731 length:171 start_codon:yes stop_codon:yes gene_type:complete
MMDWTSVSEEMNQKFMGYFFAEDPAAIEKHAELQQSEIVSLLAQDGVQIEDFLLGK